MRPRQPDHSLPAPRQTGGQSAAACLELALRAGLPLATLDADLRKALEKTDAKRF